MKRGKFILEDFFDDVNTDMPEIEDSNSDFNTKTPDELIKEAKIKISIRIYGVSISIIDFLNKLFSAYDLFSVIYIEQKPYSENEYFVYFSLKKDFNPQLLYHFIKLLLKSLRNLSSKVYITILRFLKNNQTLSLDIPRRFNKDYNTTSIEMDCAGFFYICGQFDKYIKTFGTEKLIRTNILKDVKSDIEKAYAYKGIYKHLTMNDHLYMFIPIFKFNTIFFHNFCYSKPDYLYVSSEDTPQAIGYFGTSKSVRLNNDNDKYTYDNSDLMSSLKSKAISEIIQDKNDKNPENSLTQDLNTMKFKALIHTKPFYVRKEKNNIMTVSIPAFAIEIRFDNK